MLRCRRSDPPFLRENLYRAIAAGAPCEVDIVFTADGHALCLHDLDQETTGRGPVLAKTRTEIERLRQRGPGGSILDAPPLFLDEIVEAVGQGDTLPAAAVQLDIKAPLDSLSEGGLRRVRSTLGDAAPLFIAGGYDWAMIERLTKAVPGLHAGFDPLAHYPRSCALNAEEFRRLGEATLATASGAQMLYLEAKLVLAGLRQGVNLIELVSRHGASVDVWTIDANRPGLRKVLGRVIAAGCHQITSNDPEMLGPLVEEIAG